MRISAESGTCLSYAAMRRSALSGAKCLFHLRNLQIVSCENSFRVSLLNSEMCRVARCSGCCKVGDECSARIYRRLVQCSFEIVLLGLAQMEPQEPVPCRLYHDLWFGTDGTTGTCALPTVSRPWRRLCFPWHFCHCGFLARVSQLG